VTTFALFTEFALMNIYVAGGTIAERKSYKLLEFFSIPVCNFMTFEAVSSLM
jgi:hypothetical protein